MQAIPVLLDGFDLMGCAQTGTGKTAAFALPTLQHLACTTPGGQYSDVPALPANQSRGPRPLRCLVLAPTRELAAQIGMSFNTYGKHVGLRVAVIHGGVSQSPQVRSVERGVDILVATPGRLLDLMNQQFVSLSDVEILVIDEADQMFDMGFLRDLKRIVARVPRERQTLMFSATMPDPIREIAKQWLYEPKYVEVARVAATADLIDQSVFYVNSSNKTKLLVSYIQTNAIGRSIVFVRTKHGADQIVKVLGNSGIKAVAIHGNKSQNARTRHLEQFKSDSPPILVATDIAARGIDVSGISHVINFHLPEVPEIYVHRIGRTARAGATGIAVSFCASDEFDNLNSIERLLKTKIAINDSLSELTSNSRSLQREPSSSSPRTHSRGSNSKRSAPRSNTGTSANGRTGRVKSYSGSKA